jgi:hypothetical protein
VTPTLQPPEQIRVELLAAAGRRTARRRRLVAVAAVAAAALAAAATVAAGTLAGWFGGEATYHASTQPPVQGSFPDRLSCSVESGGAVACAEGSPAAGAYPYHLVLRVHASSGGAVGAGVVSPQETAAHPPDGVPGWIGCSVAGAAYRCEPVDADTELAPGTPVYQLDFSAWTTG